MDVHDFRPACVLGFSFLKHYFHLALLSVWLSPGLIYPVSAQTFRTLHSFLGGSNGSSPYAGLTLLSNVLYGTTYFTTWVTGYSRGGFAGGTIFSIHADGSGFTTLFTFPALRNDYTSSNGTGP